MQEFTKLLTLLKKALRMPRKKRASQLPSTVTAMEDDLAPIEVEPARAHLVARLIAEFLGTAILVFGGLSAAVYGGALTPLMVPLAFALTLLVLIAAIGHISGAHLNPAVTIGMWIAGRFPARDVTSYVLAQTIGAAVGTSGLFVTLHASPTLERADVEEIMSGISILHGDASALGLGALPGGIVEFVLTSLLVAAVLSATSVRAPGTLAPVTISAALGVLIFVGLPATNASLNPARATGTWLLNGQFDAAQLWPWWLAAILAGAFVGLMYRAFGPEEDVVHEGTGAHTP